MLASLSVSNSLQQAFNSFFGYLPNLLGFVVILLVGYFIAKVVKAVVSKVLASAKMDEALQKTPAGGFVDKISPGGRPSRLVGAIVFWFIFLYVLTAAFGALKIAAVTSFIDQVLAYLPNIIAAVLIFVVAAVLAGGIVAVVQRTMGDTPTGKLAETVAPGLIMVVAVFMILTQLQIATQIVTITYAALLGMLALAGALAFGLGGRDVAAGIWSDAYDKGQQGKDRAKIDLRQGKERAQSQLSGDPTPSGAAPRPVRAGGASAES